MLAPSLSFVSDSSRGLVGLCSLSASVGHEVIVSWRVGVLCFYSTCSSFLLLAGMRFPAVHLRGQMSRLAHYGNEASDEDEFDFVDSSRSAQSDDYCMPPEAVESGSAGSPSPSRHSGLLPGFGLGSDLSEPDFLGGETDDDSDRETESDGEISNANNLEFEDEYTCDSEEALLPPQLPVVAEEKLQECWPLGDATFAIFICPITHDVMTDPVVSADGYTYERAAIARWFETSRKSPVTGQTLPHADLVPNQSVRTLLKTIIDMTEKHQEKSAQSHGKHRDSSSSDGWFGTCERCEVADRRSEADQTETSKEAQKVWSKARTSCSSASASSVPVSDWPKCLGY
ncbi:unnamed protein product [Durusdinium trenchii]|uniref:U-box domain-containing protein n=1 Tax=Durusdinium trenchii TaxID=1381693 RepID=A0ABP0MCK9_9DINO